MSPMRSLNIGLHRHDRGRAFGLVAGWVLAAQDLRLDEFMRGIRDRRTLDALLVWVDRVVAGAAHRAHQATPTFGGVRQPDRRLRVAARRRGDEGDDRGGRRQVQGDLGGASHRRHGARNLGCCPESLKRMPCFSSDLAAPHDLEPPAQEGGRRPRAERAGEKGAKKAVRKSSTCSMVNEPRAIWCVCRYLSKGASTLFIRLI